MQKLTILFLLLLMPFTFAEIPSSADQFLTVNSNTSTNVGTSTDLAALFQGSDLAGSAADYPQNTPIPAEENKYFYLDSGYGRQCYQESDCGKGYCDTESANCYALCNDNILNGNEEDVDCGGSCSACFPSTLGNGQISSSEQSLQQPENEIEETSAPQPVLVEQPAIMENINQTNYVMISILISLGVLVGLGIIILLLSFHNAKSKKKDIPPPSLDRIITDQPEQKSPPLVPQRIRLEDIPRQYLSPPIQMPLLQPIEKRNEKKIHIPDDPRINELRKYVNINKSK